MKLIFVLIAVMVGMGVIWIGAMASTGEQRCVEWETVYPTPTPVPLSHIYTEWIPMPGTAPDTGYGWVRAIDFARIQSEWPPPKKFLTSHLLTDEEYNAIAEEHGLALTQAGKWLYGFPPRQGFPVLYGGVVLKNEWLPERLR